MITQPLATTLARPLASPITRSGDYDPDALAYFERSGVTDPEAKRAVSNLIAGLKRLGEWDFTSALWSGRSSQSAGSGTIVPDIKGAHDLTLVNGPTWTTDGIQNSANGYASTTGLPIGPNSTLLLVAKADSGDQNAFGGTLSDENTKGIRIKQERFYHSDGSLHWTFFDMSANGHFQMIGGSFGTDLVGFKDAEATNLGPITPILPPSNSLALLAGVDGYGNGQQFFDGKLAFAIVLSHAITDASEIYKLLENTVCKGLDLEFDPDARSYFRHSGTTEFQEKSNISQFFSGLKNLEKWALLKEGWSGRRLQSSGIGTQLPGFKKRYDGTLVNGATREENGVTTHPSPINSHIRLPAGTAVLNKEARTLIIILKNNAPEDVRDIFSFGQVFENGKGFGAFTDAGFTVLDFWGDGLPSPTPTPTNFYCASFRYDGITASNGVNSTFHTIAKTSPSTTAHDQYYIGDTSGRGFDGTFAAVLLFATYLDDSEIIQIQTLYKNTLGQGLGLL